MNIATNSGSAASCGKMRFTAMRFGEPVRPYAPGNVDFGHAAGGQLLQELVGPQPELAWGHTEPAYFYSA